ncbi:MAG: hypothetical protein KatS3mg045_0450 [Bellilinea sp.]|nr:MAG: hypothetical protein KatS3mg045_0450 [Bellilinea sp.]
MPDYTVFEVQVSTLTPLHIGSGVELLNQYDYAIYKGHTWRIDHNRLLEAQQIEDPRQLTIIAERPPQELLQDADYRADSPFFRYVLKGTPRATGEGAVLREQIKDVYDRPYLPGSSLKGALRSALAASLWKQYGLRLEVNRLGRNPKFAAQELERSLLGANPNHDLLRALQVSDSQPLGADSLMVVNARVINRSGALGSPIEMEAIRPDVTFDLTIKVDTALFSDWAKGKQLRFTAENALRALPQLVNKRALEQVRREKAWFENIASAGRVTSFYDQVLKSQLQPNQMLLCLGWGTGWESKTFGAQMFSDPNTREALLRQFRMARGRRRPGDPFPLSRRVAVSFHRGSNGKVQESPALPLGWVLVQFQPVGGNLSLWRTP